MFNITLGCEFRRKCGLCACENDKKWMTDNTGCTWQLNIMQNQCFGEDFVHIQV